MSTSGWIGVDLDGTLAEYNGWQGIDHIGKPIPKMVNRVKKWLSEGVQVKIFTARLHAHGTQLIGDHSSTINEINNLRYQYNESVKNKQPDSTLLERVSSLEKSMRVDIITPIQDWCEEHIGVRLEVTDRKDFGMTELWDDRAVQIIPNTGERADGKE